MIKSSCIIICFNVFNCFLLKGSWIISIDKVLVCLGIDSIFFKSLLYNTSTGSIGLWILLLLLFLSSSSSSSSSSIFSFIIGSKIFSKFLFSTICSISFFSSIPFISSLSTIIILSLFFSFSFSTSSGSVQFLSFSFIFISLTLSKFIIFNIDFLLFSIILISLLWWLSCKAFSFSFNSSMSFSMQLISIIWENLLFTACKVLAYLTLCFETFFFVNIGSNVHFLFKLFDCFDCLCFWLTFGSFLFFNEFILLLFSFPEQFVFVIFIFISLWICSSKTKLWL